MTSYPQMTSGGPICSGMCPFHSKKYCYSLSAVADAELMLRLMKKNLSQKNSSLSSKLNASPLKSNFFYKMTVFPLSKPVPGKSCYYMYSCQTTLILIVWVSSCYWACRTLAVNALPCAGVYSRSCLRGCRIVLCRVV